MNNESDARIPARVVSFGALTFAASLVIVFVTTVLAHAAPPRVGERQDLPTREFGDENSEKTSSASQVGRDAPNSDDEARSSMSLRDWREMRGQAASKGPEGSSESAGPPAPWQPLVLTVVVLAVFLVGARWFRRSVGSSGFGGNRVLEVVARTPLTTKSQAVLLKVGGRAILVGVTGESVSRLGEWSEPGEVVALARDGQFAKSLRDEEESYFADEADDAESPAPATNGNGNGTGIESESRIASFRRHLSRFSNDSGTSRNGGTA